MIIKGVCAGKDYEVNAAESSTKTRTCSVEQRGEAKFPRSIRDVNNNSHAFKSFDIVCTLFISIIYIIYNQDYIVFKI